MTTPTRNRNDKTWLLVFDPRELEGDLENCYGKGAYWDRLNLKASAKAGVFYEGLTWRNVINGKMLIMVRDNKRNRLVFHELKYKPDWVE